ncbi:hypothetical protein [Sphaerisporangium sp. TRM90804]|uniref:hypothetical protein n=1 Tax=Sphaerisporangium sp. TRM90804 TaxID=3031113 RepID=UPI00244AFD4C|nr:hypothetical protein [Sphaerisporangium sp. TRM90804]MDH2426445.1 hypothetical protein [Sphaerisporangium sp. TRM90804]
MSAGPRPLASGHPTAVMWQRLLASTPVARALTDAEGARSRSLAWPLPVVLPPDLPHGPLVYLTLQRSGEFRYVGRTVQPLARRIARHRLDRPDVAYRWRWVLVAQVDPTVAGPAEEWIRAVLQPPDNRIRAAGWTRAA